MNIYDQLSGNIEGQTEPAQPAVWWEERIISVQDQSVISGDGRPERGTLSTTGEARSSNYHDNYRERKIVFYHYWPSLCCNSFYCEKNKVLYFKIIILTNHFLPLSMYVSRPWLIMMRFFLSLIIYFCKIQDYIENTHLQYCTMRHSSYIFFFNIAQNSDKKMWPESEKYRRETGTESELNRKMMQELLKICSDLGTIGGQLENYPDSTSSSAFSSCLTLKRIANM